jgi:hypothetical protein
MVMSGLIELTEAELDSVAGGVHVGSPNINVNVQLNNGVTTQVGLALNVLSPGAVSATLNLAETLQSNIHV